MAQYESEKSVDELLEQIASDNAELFELLATNGSSKTKLGEPCNRKTGKKCHEETKGRINGL